MRILLIGGHGKVALLLEPLLAEAGHHVTAVIRKPDQEADVRAAGATPLVADVAAFDTDQLASLVSGNDAVIWSDRDAAIRTVDAAVQAGVRRFLMVSYFGAGPDHGVPADDPFFAYAEAKAAADAHLRASGLDWTILAPSALTTDEPTGRIDRDAASSRSVARADVAAVLAAAVDQPATIGQTIPFNTGSTPIGEALAG
jgi:uncharacterized protein YbjT (DUF2867 family)